MWPFSLGLTHRLLSSSFSWFVFRILQCNPTKELLRALGVRPGELRARRGWVLGFGEYAGYGEI